MEGRRVLVIDNEDDAMRVCVELLINEGYEVYSTADIKSGMDMVKNLLPDMVIMDLHLPETNGIEGLRRIKNLKEETLIVLVTSRGTMDTVKEAMRHGAYDYITKPFDIELVKDVINEGLKMSPITDRLNKPPKQHGQMRR
ncbi:MAG: response regulator [Deltaproteobacteria bacterium]|nr:response regulator [Deltaproteobacteria bacterium]